MTVLTRLTLILLLLGIGVGVALRVGLKRGALMRLLPFALAPWALHLLYVVSVALRRAEGGAGALVAFILVSAALAGLAWMIARRFAVGRPLLAALVPAGLALAYGLAPLFWFSRTLRARGVNLDVIPTALLAGATLVLSVALIVYALSLPRPPGPLRWLRRR